jgi:hypothetical protein
MTQIEKMNADSRIISKVETCKPITQRLYMIF